MKKNIERILWILIGQLISAIAFKSVLLPNQLVATGLGGITTVLNNLYGLNIQLMLVLLASPIFIWSYIKYEKKQVFFAVLNYGVFTFYVGFIGNIVKPFKTDPIVASVAGGILVGIATGIIIRQQVANGPESIIGMYLKDKRDITVGTFFMIMNSVIIFSSILYGDLTLIIYSFICNYISSKVTDYVIVGTQHYFIVNIMSDNYLMVEEYISKGLKRNATFIHSMDTSNVKKKIMVKTVVNKQELVQLKAFIKQLKDDSFVYATESAGLLGGGFE